TAIPNAFAQVLFSRIPGASVSERKRLAIAQYARTLVLISGLVVLATPAFPFVVPLLYGSEFTPAATPCIIIAFAAIAAAATSVLQAIARAMTCVAVCVQAEIGSMLVLGAVAVLLSPRLELN